MVLRRTALGCALVGGVACVASLFTTLAWPVVLGLVLLAGAVGLLAVSTAGATWLRLVAGLGTVAGAACLVQLAVDAFGGQPVVGLLGAGASLLVAVSVARPTSSAPRPPARGPHVMATPAVPLAGPRRPPRRTRGNHAR